MPRRNRRVSQTTWSEDPTPRHPCPCCDYVTLPERGEWLICPVCFWEDDGQDLDQLDISSNVNRGLTLRQGRTNFREIGAYIAAMVENVCSKSEREGFALKARTVK